MKSNILKLRNENDSNKYKTSSFNPDKNTKTYNSNYTQNFNPFNTNNEHFIDLNSQSKKPTETFLEEKYTNTNSRKVPYSQNRNTNYYTSTNENPYYNNTFSFPNPPNNPNTQFSKAGYPLFSPNVDYEQYGNNNNYYYSNPVSVDELNKNYYNQVMQLNQNYSFDHPSTDDDTINDLNDLNNNLNNLDILCADNNANVNDSDGENILNWDNYGVYQGSRAQLGNINVLGNLRNTIKNNSYSDNSLSNVVITDSKKFNKNFIPKDKKEYESYKKYYLSLKDKDENTKTNTNIKLDDEKPLESILISPKQWKSSQEVEIIIANPVQEQEQRQKSQSQSIADQIAKILKKHQENELIEREKQERVNQEREKQEKEQQIKLKEEKEAAAIHEKDIRETKEKSQMEVNTKLKPHERLYITNIVKKNALENKNMETNRLNNSTFSTSHFSVKENDTEEDRFVIEDLEEDHNNKSLLSSIGSITSTNQGFNEKRNSPYVPYIPSSSYQKTQKFHSKFSQPSNKYSNYPSYRQNPNRGYYHKSAYPIYDNYDDLNVSGYSHSRNVHYNNSFFYR